MRAAFVTNRAAHYRLPIFRLLAERFSVDFYFTATSPGRWWTTEHRESTAGLNSTSAVSAMSLYRFLRQGGYDCIVSSLTGRTHLAAIAAAVDLGRHPFTLWVELWEYPRSAVHAVGRPLVDHLLRRADSIVAGGAHTSAWIEREIGRSSGLFLLQNPVDNAHFSQSIADAHVGAVRSSFQLSTETVACYVGRLEPEKGLPVLLGALSKAPPNVGLVIIGSGSCANEIHRLTSDHGMRDRVRSLGWVSQEELPVYYRACDFLVLPSVSTPRVRETWGLVANEAMICGLPVIATDAVGAAAGGLVTHGETGLVVPERDVDALAGALEELARNPEFRAALGVRARARAETYTFESAADVFDAAIAQAIGSREPG